MNIKVSLIFLLLIYIHSFHSYSGYWILGFLVLYLLIFLLRRNFGHKRHKSFKNLHITEPKHKDKALTISNALIRKNIEYLSDQEFDRFMRCVDEMKDSGDFYSVASIHGDYCRHGVEGFPLWHRVYLLEFESRLQSADRRLGGDGRICVPYWDWTEDTSIPSRILDAQPNGSKISKDLTDRDLRNLDRRGTSIRRNNPSSAIRHSIRNLYRLFNARNHTHFASLNSGYGYSLEQFHNDVHNAVGFPMSTIGYAAFDLIFWLHHCNVDRIYQTYIKGDRSWLRTFTSNNRDEFERPLSPFRNPNTRHTYRCEDFSNPYEYGRIYDVAYEPHDSFRGLLVSPVTVVFENCDIMKFSGKSYMIHLFVSHKNEELKIPSKQNDFYDHPNYAGYTSIFGKGPGCRECKDRSPFMICVDIQETITRLNLSRYDIKLTVKCVDLSSRSERILDIENIPMPTPKLKYDLFENKTRIINPGDNHPEIAQLQKWLVKYGYYAGDIDSHFGPMTEKAVQQAKEVIGFHEKSGKVTKDFLDYILRPRCHNSDIGVEEVAWIKPKQQQTVNEAMVEFMKDNVITYYVDDKNYPYYIKGDIEKDIKMAFEVWGDELKHTFEKVTDQTKAELKIVWKQHDNTEFQSDGRGGILAYGVKEDNTIYMDAAEKWSTMDSNNGDKSSPIIFVVLVHEIGHVFGLNHSNNTTDVMAPYYNIKNIKLQPGEIERLHKLYPILP